MPEQRSRHHRERVADAIRDEISIILEGELADPRIGMATVTEVVPLRGDKVMHVYVHVEGSDEEGDETIEGLNAAKSYVRRQVAQRLSLRHMPELVFHVDRSVKHGSRIEELLARVKKRNKNSGIEKQ